MNWFAWAKDMALILLVAGPIWLLALISHQQGNATAINALVGIPVALGVAAVLVALATWGTGRSHARSYR